jgi:hypothetical protein
MALALLTRSQDHGINQAVSRAVSRVQYHARPHGICDGQIVTRNRNAFYYVSVSSVTDERES